MGVDVYILPRANKQNKTNPKTNYQNSDDGRTSDTCVKYTGKTAFATLAKLFLEGEKLTHREI